MFSGIKKVLSFILILSCLTALCSCQFDNYGSQDEIDEQTTEQTTQKNSEKTSSEETQADSISKKPINHIRLEESGDLILYYSPKIESSASGNSRGKLTHVKTCMARIANSRGMRVAEKSKNSTTIIAKSYLEESYFDYIYVVFERGYNLSNSEMAIINQYKIAYEFKS